VDDENGARIGWKSYSCDGHLSHCDASMCLHTVGTLVRGGLVDEQIHYYSCTCKAFTTFFSSSRGILYRCLQNILPF
jgi:hypothetical protein